MKRALLLAPEAPYPLAGGGALRTASLLHYLVREHVVDLILFRQSDAPDPRLHLPQGLARKVTVIDLPPHRRGTTARAFRNTIRLLRQVPPLFDRFSGFGPQVSAAVEGERYDVAVIEHFWCAPYWAQVSRTAGRTVLNLHNIESVLHERCACAENGPAALAHRIFAGAALELEREWIPRFSDVLVASQQDAALTSVRAPGARLTVYPNAVRLPPLIAAHREHVVVFSGNLEYHPNVTAVRFFRREVWPRLRERWPGLVWRLLGRNPDAVKPWTAGDSQIQVTGPVPDAIAELARAEVAVVPLLSGSGTRLKILEAWGAVLPVVSTTLGAEGLPVLDGRHILIADGGERFAGAVSRLLADAALRQELGLHGRLLLESEFTWDKAWQSLNL